MPGVNACTVQPPVGLLDTDELMLVITLELELVRALDELMVAKELVAAELFELRLELLMLLRLDETELEDGPTPGANTEKL